MLISEKVESTFGMELIPEDLANSPLMPFLYVAPMTANGADAHDMSSISVIGDIPKIGYTTLSHAQERNYLVSKNGVEALAATISPDEFSLSKLTQSFAAKLFFEIASGKHRNLQYSLINTLLQLFVDTIPQYHDLINIGISGGSPAIAMKLFPYLYSHPAPASPKDIQGSEIVSKRVNKKHSPSIERILEATEALNKFGSYTNVKPIAILDASQGSNPSRVLHAYDQMSRGSLDIKLIGPYDKIDHSLRIGYIPITSNGEFLLNIASQAIKEQSGGKYQSLRAHGDHSVRGNRLSPEEILVGKMSEKEIFYPRLLIQLLNSILCETVRQNKTKITPEIISEVSRRYNLNK